MILRPFLTIALVLATAFPVDGLAGTKGYEFVRKDGYAYRILSTGPLKDRIAWALDKPNGKSNPLGLLLHHLRGANDIVWASYKPTHPHIVAALNGHKRAWGSYDLNYCGSACLDAYQGNVRVSPVRLGVYKAKSKRKWFVMHHKFAILNRAKDGAPGNEAVLTGSFNWNESAAEKNYENIVYIKSRKIADAFWLEYERIGGRSNGNSEPIHDGDITAAFNAAGASFLQQRISKAKTSILAAVWSLSISSANNPNPIYDALKAAAARGVHVRIATDAHKAKKRNYVSLDVVKIPVPHKKGHMHHKFMVIDQEYVVTGSFNFVTKSFSGNFENVVAIKSPAMAASFTDHWKAMAKMVQ
jgi:phosphatidylserine/phosphatidylglycerophosphate/cardiolipin synthase-like enzyme